ncbi:MAG: peptidoglycan DD-metalloendopeptidase family protein [Candidatus Magasanikiibacteriota bacterium]
MQRLGYKILLYILRGLTYLKKALFWLLRINGNGLFYILNWFRNTIGFRFYKAKFQLEKHAGILKMPWNSKAIELFGKRGTLQIILFIIIFVIAIPHTRLYARDTTKIPGRDTILYKIVGPGEQDFDLTEITIDSANVTIKPVENSWQQGAIQIQPRTLSGQTTNQPTNIASIALGGTAITKPNIITGANITNSSNDTGREEIIIHNVETGDTIGTIAEKYNIDVNTLLWSNSLTLRSYIRPGDKLKILPTSGLIHKIKKGDTLSKIAKTYSAEADKIIEFNKLKDDGSDLVIGEEIMIPGGKMPQPVYTYTQPTRQYNQLSNISAPPASATAIGSGYLWPTSVRRITQYYSWRHTGLDIAGPVGTPLYATKAGTVIKSQCGYNSGYGCYIILNNGGGIQTVYAHASRLFVSVGEEVVQGQTIALMGSTGRSTGPHIHFEVRINGSRMNPLKYVK